ncbi:HalOD1 output domain-containing protein [Haladaptatus halobius]|uniref:HalOD1 output domain-containing protein n=1 Tax=Haladaptatus halobius TaxID=2884875 RepID=UPI001D0AA1B9|nr:HalOD1 output domain-containing protein [Haladaptatus halobius]
METKTGSRTDGRGDDRLSLAVLTAVMDAAGYEDAGEFDTCLYDAIDPDALDSLFHRRTANGRVEFSWAGFDIRVHSDGRVTVFDT